MPKQTDRALPDPTVYDDTTGMSVPWREYFERHPSSSTRPPLIAGERVNPFWPVKWRNAPSINPFGPPPQPWERGQYRFRLAYDRARAVFQEGDAIVAHAEDEADDPALVSPELFAAAVSAAARFLDGAVPPSIVSEVARSAALVAWHDALADHADRASGR